VIYNANCIKHELHEAVETHNQVTKTGHPMKYETIQRLNSSLKICCYFDNMNNSIR